jgi:hypothetical protein
MKRLLDEAAPSLGGIAELLASAERYQTSPFAKRHVYTRILRELERGPKNARLRPVLLGAGALLVAATAAAAGVAILTPSSAPVAPTPARVVEAPREPVAAAPPALASVEAPSSEVQEKIEKPSERRSGKTLRAGEDPTQVAEAVRALRKQGDAARAQALLDRYLESNPRGALAEDALALSIEAAAARKDPRAAEYARRYLARYPQGRFRALAERVSSKK